MLFAKTYPETHEAITVAEVHVAAKAPQEVHVFGAAEVPEPAKKNPAKHEVAI